MGPLRALLEIGVPPHVKHKASFLPGSGSTAAKQGTPLIAAARGGHLEAVEALLLAGAPVDGIDIWGNTPMIWAAYGGHFDVVRRLLNGGANLHARQKFGLCKPIHMAAYGKGHQVVDELIAHSPSPTCSLPPWLIWLLGCDPSQIWGVTNSAVNTGMILGIKPLHFAAMMNDGDTIQALVANRPTSCCLPWRISYHERVSRRAPARRQRPLGCWGEPTLDHLFSMVRLDADGDGLLQRP